MSNLDLVWDDKNSRGDFRITGGRSSTGNLLVTAVWISLFTDRVAQPDYKPPAGSDDDRRGWWCDTFNGRPIGSRLWQLRRRSISDRAALVNEADDMLMEALKWMVDDSLVAKVIATSSVPPAGLDSSGTMLLFHVQLFQPDATSLKLSRLWSVV